MLHSKYLPFIVVFFAALCIDVSAQAQGGGRGGGRGAAAASGSAPVDISQSRTMDQAAITRGGTLFAAQCASCHGANARGGSKTKTDVDLVRSAMVLDDLGTGGREIGDYLKYGRPEKGMPKFDLTEQQSSDIAMWLHRQVSAAAERGTYVKLNVFSGDAKAGEAFFNGPVGKCNTCHSATGDMKGLVAKNNDDAPTIQGLIVSGGGRGGRGGGGRGAAGAPATPSPTAITAKITLKNGEVIDGFPASIDDWQITIRLPDGKMRTFLRDGDWPKYETHNPLQAHVDLQFKYTDADIHNLAAYLRTLK